ncbi:uncharacterized protein NPIL_225571 [Nephila pilipes]|uniref:Uncharacterized protein n=1 Tax=Nephila pilipes TaxID=299642 RepID=A0A8X6QMR2_NEPPI|nr:uncharacterized protein NPIL_225571 [Nephila pilipes]
MLGKMCSLTIQNDDVCDNAPILLVGNKADLVNERQVTPEMVAEIMRQPSRRCRYIETSAKFNDNVSQLFQELLQHAHNLEHPPPPPPPAQSSRRLSRRLSSLGNINFVVRRRSSVPRENEPRERSDHKSCVIS